MTEFPLATPPMISIPRRRTHVMAVVAAAMVTVGSVQPTMANAPVSYAGVDLHAECWDVPTPLGLLQFIVTSSAQDGSTSAYVAVIDEVTGEPVILGNERSVVVALSDQGFAVSVPVGGGEDVAIEASLTAIYSYDGTPSRDGIAWDRSSGTLTESSVTGTVDLPGVAEPVSFGPSGCSASQWEGRVFVTQPHASMRDGGRFAFGSCEAESAGTVSTMTIHMSEDGSVSIDGDSFSSETSAWLERFHGQGTLADDGSVSIPLTVWTPGTYEDLGPGQADLVFDEGKTVRFRTRQGDDLRTTIALEYHVSGSWTTSLGRFPADRCWFYEGRDRFVTTPSEGPKPAGPVPANDAPAGAVELAPGQRLVQSTRGAAPTAETSPECVGPYMSVTLHPEYTVWFLVEGTGDPVTIDTAGSHFATTLSVHRGSPSAAQTCDVSIFGTGLNSSQAVLTFPTERGERYWIQIGGTPPGFWFDGPTYGLLKLSMH